MFVALFFDCTAIGPIWAGLYCTATGGDIPARLASKQAQKDCRIVSWLVPEASYVRDPYRRSKPNSYLVEMLLAIKSWTRHDTRNEKHGL